ncbi:MULTISPECIES: ABC transporter permease [unclassified Nodularia (in: cyanobacteria)]|uniref:ABC transporter permease n=1 Tax=unclassified Nodularia (in: cyanobacteria) TaxID=2656917 RepID=UPI00187EB891|nr:MULTISPECIES: ABC transporter permease [unclassified Nodularia (in: cyanobacteria)]MBE9201709.1 ABC transporter permease [Nodularia sp. LEGE 06071]MCC2691262.1 ABC transporter permease [Nodularia sp. LEGE 04288]
MNTDEIHARAKKLVTTRQELGIRRAFADSLIIGQRNLILLSRFPTVAVSVVLIPIIFLSGFLITFEKLMATQEINYIQYLLPIITLQAMFFTAMGAAANLSYDMQSGMFQRCRAMPISPLATFGGLLIAYLVRALISITILVSFAHLYGFRFQAGFLSAIGFLVLTLLFTTTTIAGYAVLALALKQPDLVQSLSIVPYAPLLLLSTGFSPAENFPQWLQPIVLHQPVSYTAEALRVLVSGGELLNPLFWSLTWLLGLLLIFVFVSIQLNQRRSQ